METSGGITLSWTALAGGGFIGTVLLLALVERLRRVFATREDLNGLGRKYAAVETLYIQLRDGADELRDRLVGMSAAQQHQSERLTEQVIRPLSRVMEKLEAISEAQAAHAAALEQLERRAGRLEDGRQSSQKP